MAGSQEYAFYPSFYYRTHEMENDRPNQRTESVSKILVLKFVGAYTDEYFSL